MTKQECNAWNPGLKSEIPARLLPKVTLFLPENSEVDYASAKEAAAFCGLEAKEMTGLRLERLIIHELLIRVTADLSVPDGPNYEDLGINLRAMTARILDGYVMPRLDDIRPQFEALKTVADKRIREILDADIFGVAPEQNSAEATSVWTRLFRKKTVEPALLERTEVGALRAWRAAELAETEPLQRACLRSLITVVGGIVGQRGRLVADMDIIANMAGRIVSNTYGSVYVGQLIEPIIAEAAKGESYHFLPVQKKPFFMNVKGSSAAGKSTIRPAQRALAEKLDIPWKDFALISPDYWRKFLLDYESLGEDYKYAAMLTGQELEIIDKKLDRYMEEKASRNALPHLLIDRFRFDSFDVSKGSGQNSQLLTRFGDTVFLFFVITPPAATVERAWKRGITTGRYKAVDDLLYHNIEAYTGMPHLFFSSVLATDKKIHFEFLDNSVALGQRPRTIAFGWNGKMTILDLERMNDITRFKNVNINATRPEDVLEHDQEQSFAFLKSCLKRIPDVTLADHATSRVYGRIQDGKWTYKDPEVIGKYGKDSFVVTCLSALGWDRAECDDSLQPMILDIETEQHVTLGEWGRDGPSASQD